jgi:hypothetical protein
LQFSHQKHILFKSCYLSVIPIEPSFSNGTKFFPLSTLQKISALRDLIAAPQRRPAPLNQICFLFYFGFFLGGGLAVEAVVG